MLPYVTLMIPTEDKNGIDYHKLGAVILYTMSAASNINITQGAGSERFFRVAAVLDAMKRSGLSDEFVAHLLPLAMEYDGTYELMLMWFSEPDQEVCDEIIADLQGEIEEELSEPILPKHLKKEDYFHFDNLEAIAKNVMQFKKALRLVVDRKGGLNKLAETTKIPRPSLSRFFNTASLPRRNTLEKIARALDLRKNSEEYALLKKWFTE